MVGVACATWLRAWRGERARDPPDGKHLSWLSGVSFTPYLTRERGDGEAARCPVGSECGTI